MNSYSLIFVLFMCHPAKALLLEYLGVQSMVCEVIDFCLLRDANAVKLPPQPKCPVLYVSDETLTPTCGLQEEVSNDTCLEGDEEETICNHPIPQPLLCRYLGDATSCSVCLKSIQTGSCGGLMTFSLFAVTGSALAIVHQTSDILYSDHKFAVKGDFLENLFLLKELVTGAISTFIVVINFLVHFDRRRFLQNRELRWRLLQLIHHLYIIPIEIIMALIMFFQRLITLYCFQAITILNALVFHQVINDLYVTISRILTQLFNGTLWMQYRLTILCGPKLPCGCWRWRLKRSHKVDDNSCCSPGNLRRPCQVDADDDDPGNLYS